jgi:5-methylcytosine-specific restriction endonuclease McrA
MHVKKSRSKLQSWLVQRLRRISYAWPDRQKAYQNARVERGRYKCAICDNIFGPKEVQLDHIVPVIDPHQGFTDWDDYIKRMFVDVSGFQVLCKGCHAIKTHQENIIRKRSDS